MGAAGGIGQPMSLLLKQNNLVSELALYDIVATPGVAADLSHIETRSQVEREGGREGERREEGREGERREGGSNNYFSLSLMMHHKNKKHATA